MKEVNVMKKILVAAFAAAFLAHAPFAAAQVSISSLPSATTPLAGTEVSPLVQSGTTVKAPASAWANQAAVPFTGLSFNKVTITQPASGSTLTIADGKTLTDTSGIGAKLLLGATGGGYAAYGGATCTNQALTVLSNAGVATCSSITNSFLTAGTFSSITGTGTLTAGATGAGFTVALGTSTVTGVLPAANGGAGTITGALKGNGAGTVSQAACADLSNGTTACSTALGTSGATIPLLNGNNTTSGNNTHSGTETYSSQIITSAGLPTIANGACGAGANGAVAAGSTNQSGQITIGASATTTCTIVFSATLGAAPKACHIQPANAAAAAVATTVAYVSSITTAQFVITGTALANANYGYTCL